MFNIFKKKKVFPPVPKWKPEIVQSLDEIIERASYYTNRNNDFVVFSNGTLVMVGDSLSDQEAESHAKEALHGVYHAHPDMNPMNMDDGNILITYKNNVANIVLSSVVDQNWDSIDKNHQNALATDEVLITPLGNNKFDDFGKKSLFGRCFMFLDAQENNVVRIVRKNN